MAWPLPDRSKVLGDRGVTLVPLDLEAHGAALFRAASVEANGGDIFAYSLGPPQPATSESEYLDYVRQRAARTSDLAYAVFRGDEIVGSASLLDIRPEHGVVEVGSIWYAKRAQRTEVNTLAMFALLSYVLGDLAYRRVEWKCHNENEASKAAALRLGFQYEGLFRQHFWSKGSNRDTAWYSIIDTEWPAVKQRFTEKLLPNRERSDG